MARPRRPRNHQSQQPAEPPDEDQQGEQPEPRGLALDPRDAAREGDADGEEQAGKVAEMAVRSAGTSFPTPLRKAGPSIIPEPPASSGTTQPSATAAWSRRRSIVTR